MSNFVEDTIVSFIKYIIDISIFKSLGSFYIVIFIEVINIIKLKSKKSMFLGVLFILLTQFIFINDIHNLINSTIELVTLILLMDILIFLIVTSFFIQIKISRFIPMFAIAIFTIFSQCINEKRSLLETALLMIVALLCFINLYLTRNNY